MASLTKKKTSKNWIAVLTLSDGRRTNRSTGTSDKKKAQRIADDLQRIENEGRENRITEEAIRRNLNEMLKRHTGESINQETVKDFLRSWIDGKNNQHTRERYQYAVDSFQSSLGSKANGLLSLVTYRDVTQYLTQRSGAQIASKTLSVDAKILNSAFNLAKKLQFIQENPFEKALALKPIEVSSSKKAVFSKDEIQALVTIANPDWKAVILLGVYCGARLTDCTTMRWENINLVKRQICYYSTKNKKQIELPLHPALYDYFKSLTTKDKNETYISPSLAGKSTSGKSGLSGAFTRLMEKAGIDPERVDGKGKRKFSAKTFHSLRHSFNSMLANSGVSQETRMKLIGHASEQINDQYTHIQMETLRRDIENLPSFKP
jgi:integrase